MKPLTIAIAFFIYATSIAVAAAKNHGKRKMKIALLTSNIPWSFGPYQSQMHKLSLLLNDLLDDDEIEYDVYWLPYAKYLPTGVYKTYNQLRPHLGNQSPPPTGFPLDHITFLGVADGQLSNSKLNAMQKEYGFDCMVTLLDISRVVPDEPFNIPVLAWIPLHSETVKPSSSDYWSLRQYHGVAGLAPSGAKAIQDAVGTSVELELGLSANNPTAKAIESMIGSAAVEFIPHIFDRTAISASADVGLEMLKDHSVADADSKLNKTPLINRGQESTLESGHPHSLFGEERKNDFVILLQGGNYEAEDRKGWDTSIQAFVRFYNSLDDASGVHLLIHSMESYLIAADSHSDADAPASVMPIGYNHRLALHEYGLPRDAYTIDIAKHAPEVVAAYKKRADVCLHPSKVEGFGMNVMECQAVGTPVITTNYTAMGDFTKLGRSVPHRQMIKSPSMLYAMALPDVVGIADALGEMYEEHLALKRGEKKAVVRRESEVSRFNEWIDSTCSMAVVGDKFKSLLLRTYSEFSDRQRGKAALFSEIPPTAGAYEIVSGYHGTIVDWDAPWTLIAPDGLEIVDPTRLNKMAWMMLLNDGNKGPPPMAIVIPAKYEDGTDVPFMNADQAINEDLPVLVRTFMLTAMQGHITRRKSLLTQAIQNAGMPQQAGNGFAIVKRNRKGVTYHNEL